MTDTPKVAICIPTGDDCKTDFAISLAYLMRDATAHGIATHVVNYRSSMISKCREMVAHHALQSDITHMLWIDSDMIFPPWALRQLLSRDQDIVASNACLRNALKPSLPCSVGAAVGADGLFQRPYTTAGDALVEVDRIGFPFVLHTREVMERIPSPRFETPWIPETCEYESEDYDFCRKAREAGYRIMVDPVLTRQMGHTGSHIYMLTSEPIEVGRARGICWNADPESGRQRFAP